jgi:hypothetical protein
MAKKLELSFDEILDFVQEQKMNSLKALESKNKQYLKELDGKEQSIDERIHYFSEILDEVTNLRQNSQTPEEELFVFFFGNQEKISNSLKEESNQFAESETMKINKFFDDFTQKTKFEQMKHVRNGQELIREKLLKNIQAIGGCVEEKESPVSIAKSITKTADFPKVNLTSTRTGFSKPVVGSTVTLGDAENSNHFVNKFSNHEKEIVSNSKRLQTFNNSETYNQFVEKVKALPSRANTSVEINKYIAQTRALSRGSALSKPGEVSLLPKDYTTTSYYKTLSKNNYNLEKKMELEQKLKFFDLKTRKEELTNNGVLGFGNGPVKAEMPNFQMLTTSQKYRPETKTELRSTINSSNNSGFKAGTWMFSR